MKNVNSITRTPHVAGAKYVYRDEQVHLLTYIMTQIAGEPLEALFTRRIAEPIGMTRWEWKNFGTINGLLLNSGSGIYGSGIHTTARELARFGHLFLCRGNWDGDQLLSASWIDQATATQVPASTPCLVGGQGSGVYGFYWWTNGTKPNGQPWPSAPLGTYAARGGVSNYCFVIPEWNMVVVRMARTGSISQPDRVWDAFLAMLGEEIGWQ